MGVANDRSIAWGIARAVAAEGATLAFTYQGEALQKRVKPLADQVGARHVLPCDVSDEAQVLRFRDELLAEHGRDHVHLVFANAGVGGGSSFVKDSREEWERTFAIDWWGVYYCARAFLPLLIASGDGVLVNTSSVSGLWAALGPGIPNTAYSTAKFAVRGLSLIHI